MPFFDSAHPLDTGAKFPALRLTTIDDRTLELPANTGRFGVVLIYRGEW